MGMFLKHKYYDPRTLDTGYWEYFKYLSYTEITGILKYYWKTLIFWLFILEFYLKYYDFRLLKF